MTPREHLRERIGAKNVEIQKVEKGAEGRVEKKDPKVKVIESRAASYVGILIAAIITLVINYFIVTYNQKRTIGKIWLPEQLALHNGSDPSLRLLLSITGSVFDVTKGKEHYGKGNSYNHFCGRDASRAFVTGDFSEKGLVSDVHGLSFQQLNGLHGWIEFYHNNYPFVGRLVGKFYTGKGKPTRDLIHLKNLFDKVKIEIERQKQLESLHPTCNSRYSSKEGGQVWCEVGYPRKVLKFNSVDEMRGQKSYRCACYDEKELEDMEDNGDMEEYENCSPFSSVCQTTPPSQE